MYNLRSLVLLSVITSLILFLVGFRFGKFIERQDKSYTPPSPIPSPTVTVVAPTSKPIGFKTFDSTCDVSFTYPTFLTAEKSSSDSAILKKDSQTITLACQKKSPLTNAQDTSSSSATIIHGQKVYKENLKKGIDTWSINSQTGKHIIFETSKNLTSLVQSTLEFVKSRP
ncbi:MAG: hypothetical protein ACMG6E_02100 [Candidatus Roizmanbacteria bacterium]